jgi:tripartite motif-containing protein 71
MNKLPLMTASALAALAAACVWGEWVYEGEWGKYGNGNRDFSGPSSVAVAPGGRVYVTEYYNTRVQYFTPDGSFVGKWGTEGSGNGQFEWPMGVAVAPSTGDVYVADFGASCRIQYFTHSGSFLGKWGRLGSGNGEFRGAIGVAVARNGAVYVADCGNHRVQYFTADGSFLGTWGRPGNGGGEFYFPSDVAVAPNGNIYVLQSFNQNYRNRVQYFTAYGSYINLWEHGFATPHGIGIAPGGRVFVADSGHNRVQYFTASGSFLGSWGKYGSKPGEFWRAEDAALSPSGKRLYVADWGNNRIQYFRWSAPAVSPTSLGRVKALFR